MGMIYIAGLLEGWDKIPRYLPGNHRFLYCVGVD